MPHTVEQKISQCSLDAFAVARELRAVVEHDLGPGRGADLVSSLAADAEKTGHALRSLLDPGAESQTHPRIEKSKLTDIIDRPEVAG